MRLNRRKDTLLKLGALAVAGGLLAGPAWAQDPFDPMEADDPFAAFDDPQQQPPPGQQQPPFDPAFGEQPPAQPPMDSPFDDPMADPTDPFADPTDPFADPAMPAQPDDPFAPGVPFDPEEAPPMPTGPDPETQPDPDRLIGTTEPAETGISQLYTFRFIRQRNFLGNDVVVRRRMTVAEGEQFDETVRNYYRELLQEGEIPMFQPGMGNPNEWAEWLTYAAQVEMWAEYAQNIVLGGTRVPDDLTHVSWPGDPAPDEEGQQVPGMTGFPGGPGMGMGMGMPGQQFGQQPGQQERRPAQRFEFSPVPDTRGGQQPGAFGGPAGGMVIDPAQMDEQMVEIYQDVWRELRTVEERQLAQVRELNESLDTRERMREEYDLWREDQKQQLVAWVSDWSRRYDGQTVLIGDVQYELYGPEAIPDTVPRGAHLVVTDFGITPYDILEEDGTLKGPDRN